LAKRKTASEVANSIIEQSIAKDRASYEKMKVSESLDGLVIESESIDEVRNGSQAIRKAGFDPRIWEVYRTSATSWQVPVKIVNADGSNTVQVKNCWRVHVECRRRIPESASEAIKSLADSLPSLRLQPIRYKKSKDRNVLVIGCADFHFGKATVSGDGSLKSIGLIYDAMVTTMIERSGVQLSEIIFANLGDMLHTDNASNTTTAGTPQSVTSTHQQIYEAAQESLIRAIARCRDVAPTTFLTMQGNHDWNASQHLSSCMKAVFKNVKGVDVDNAGTHSGRKYITRGVNLVGFTHGDKERPGMLAGLMANEAKKDWAATSNRLFLRGHLHHRKTEKCFDAIESDGVMVYTLPSPSGIDQWHHDSGYVTSKRCVQGFVLSEAWGTRAILEASVEELLS
jgi:hypothetical protein